MADIEVTSTSEEGYTTTSVTGEWELVVDATGEDGPTPNQVLAADYASCFIPAFRVGANKEGFDDIGRIEVAVEAELDDDDDLSAISFDIHVEESLDDSVDDVVARGEDICHVHSALREELHADITVIDDAF
ncbi:MAG: OsmC family protein [Haloarculaceae archaeon]